MTCPAYAGIKAPVPGDDPYLGAKIDLYNALGEQTTQATPLGEVTQSTFDPEGQVVSQIKSSATAGVPAETTVNTYNSDHEAVTTTAGTGTTLTAYDPTGNAYCTVAPDAVAKGVTCPPRQPAWLVSPPSPAAIPAGITLTIDNAQGKVVQTTTPDKGTSVNINDQTGNVYCTITADNLKSWLAANKGSTYPYSCPQEDPKTAPTGVSTGYTTTVRNAAGQTTSVTTPTGVTTATAYDSAGLRSSVTKGGEVTTYCHYSDACAEGAPSNGGAGSAIYSSSRPATSGQQAEETTDTYTPSGQVAVRTTPAVVESFSYNADGAQTAVTYSTLAAGYTAPSNATTTYDVTGEPSSTATSDGTTS